MNRPPSALRFAIPRSLPATQRQRYPYEKQSHVTKKDHLVKMVHAAWNFRLCGPNANPDEQPFSIFLELGSPTQWAYSSSTIIRGS